MDQSGIPSSGAIREQLEKLQHSQTFATSERLVTFLRFLVEETLNNRRESLKESVVGNALYGRSPPYDPRIDSTVRVEARRLRRKLTEYYAKSGSEDPVRISLPTGGYVPEFSMNNIAEKLPSACIEQDQVKQAIFESGAGAAIAIMPFRSLSKDGAEEDFADGLTDELIFAMARAPGLRVVSRSAAFQHKDKSYSSSELVHDLGVDAVLYGTVRTEGNVVRVTVEAFSAKGFVVWSDRFDAPRDEKMLLQERIAATLLSRIKFDSTKMRTHQVQPGPAAVESNAKVYRARQLVDQQTPDALHEALEIFISVGQSAPDYARGHSGVADCYCDLYRLGLIGHASALVGAKPAVLKALEIDSESSEAHTALATIAAWLERNRESAETNFQNAIELGSNIRAARHYGVFLTLFGRHNEAEDLFREARQMDPFSYHQDIAEATGYYQARRYDLLIETQIKKIKHHAPVEAMMYRAMAHIFCGDVTDAQLLLNDIGQGTSKHPNLLFAKAELEALLGRPEQAIKHLNSTDKKATFFARATLAASIKDESRSLDALEAAVNQRELSAVWMRTDPRFDWIRDKPRFTALLEKLGL